MNIKLRFALLFTLLVGAILMVSSLVTYYLYQTDRTEDFYRRLKSEASILYRDFNAVGNTDTTGTLNIIDQLHSNNLFNEKLVLFNKSYEVIYEEPADSALQVKDVALFQKINKQTEYRYKDGDRECLGMYMEAANAYILVSAIDRSGLKKLSNLKFILLGVFVGALLIAAVISFFFVESVFKPLVNLSSQMERTTATNLTEQIDDKSSYAEINQIARNFNAMRKRLNHAFESQKTFVHHASHELRTPLTTMLSHTEAALNRNLDTQGYKNVLRSLKEDQSDLIELTNSLLLISQYEKMSFSQSWPTERIDELLYDTIANCKRIFVNSEINLDFEALPEDENDLMIKANDALIKSAFRNLIKNAYIYSDNKKVKIVIKIQKPLIEVCFINSGNQLSSTEIEKMQMPFFRGKNSMTKKGFGLGLSIATKIVELHQGVLLYVPVETKINHFIIKLPMASTEA